MGLWGFFKKSRGYLEDSRIIMAPDIRRVLRNNIEIWEGEPRAEIRDLKRRILTEKHTRDFVYKYHDTRNLSYGFNHAAVDDTDDSFPDCDEFAIVARANVSMGAIKESFDYAPCFGGISYRPSSGGMHRANIAFWDRESVITPVIFEPQTGEFKDFSDEVSVVRQVSI